MTEKVFKTQMERLQKNWGPDKYAEERIKLFWEKLQALPDHWFVSACSDFIANRIKPPMLYEFLADAEDFMRREKDRRAYARTTEEQTARKEPTMEEVHRLVTKVVEHTKRLAAQGNLRKLSGRDRAAGRDED